MLDYSPRRKVSLPSLGAVTNSTNTEFDLAAPVTDLSILAVNSKEQDPSLPELRM